MHDTPLISLIALGLSFALVGGLVAAAGVAARRFRVERVHRVGQNRRHGAITLAKVGLLVALMLTIVARPVHWLMGTVRLTGSREPFTPAVALASGTACLASHFFGVSFALGAFILGALGKSLGLPSDDAYAPMLAGALLSIVVNPFAFKVAVRSTAMPVEAIA